MKNWVVIGILFLAFFLRVVDLQNHPAGFTPDEASFGWDSYSILRTGKDQWGQYFPLSLRSFGDFKLPLYSYLDIPFVALFGLNEVAVRLPNALIGSLAVLITYLLVKELLKREDVAFLAAFLLATSPWHVPLSRGAFEANLTTFFLPLGILLFIKGLKKERFLPLAALIFGVNLFSYHSARFVTPFVLLFLILFYRKKLRFKKETKKAFLILGIFISLAFYTQLIGSSRISSSGIFNPTGGWGSVVQERYSATLAGLPDFFSRLFNNKVVYFLETFFHNYLSYLSPQFLFTEGPKETTYGMLPGMGVLYFIELPFIICFVVNLARKPSKEVLLILLWILIGIVPAALTKGPGHAANRAAFVMPAIQIVSALGGVSLYDFILRKIVVNKRLIFSFFAIFYFISFCFFFEKYWFGQPVKGGAGMIYGTRELFSYLSKVQSFYSQIIVSKSISEPHIYTAFFNKIPANIYQEQSKKWLIYEDLGIDWVDQLPSYSLTKYTFTSIDYLSQKSIEGVLFVGKPSDFPSDLKPDYVVKYLDRTDAFWVVDPATQYWAVLP